MFFECHDLTFIQIFELQIALVTFSKKSIILSTKYILAFLIINIVGT